jgi:ATP-binding cassette subfamily C (CFTR/MRP) protein 1
MTIVPRVISAFAGFERIQNYLLRPSLAEQRRSLPHLKSTGQPWNSSSSESTELDLAISLQGLTIGGKQPVLEAINIDMTSGSLTIISGPVGCGKSMLLRAIIGEVAPSQGSVTLASTRIAYCAQKSWLPGGTIKEAIVSDTRQEDENWYRQVVAACCLEHDFANLPRGDETQVGSRGGNLSGGQKQRVVSKSCYEVWDKRLTIVGACTSSICQV